MAGTWFKMMLVPHPTQDSKGSIKMGRRILIGRIDKPTRVPWWFQDDFEKWSTRRGQGRELSWEEFPIDEWFAELYSRSRPIDVSRPTYPVQLPKFAFATEAMVKQVHDKIEEMTSQQADFTMAINPMFLRSLGIVFQEDINSEGQYKELVSKGYQAVNISDGTPGSLMPWLPAQMYMDFSPAVEPEEKAMRVGARQIVSWTEWTTEADWDNLMDQMWKTDTGLVQPPTDFNPLKVE